ncbi:MAG: sulfurtransferase [Acidimicrobiia bacterium]|nr:sulfurtransferase [Acidimicrobiia bacterium]
MNPLIRVPELAGRLDELKLFDVRWSLTEPGHGLAAYRDGHIPGAVFVDLDHDLSAPTGAGRHPLPDVGAFAGTLGRLGVSPDDEVVVYDDVGGTIAARMWWMLRAIGHGASRVLDGGLSSWVQAGEPLESGERIPSPVDYPTPNRFAGVVTVDQLEGRTVIDARAPERYRGEVEPVDPKAGHIPGAINRPTSDNLAPAGTMKEPVILRKIYEGLEDAVVSCGSGVTACHDALSMMVAGYEMPDLYIGSFSEWSRLDLPVATGPEP